MAGVLLTLFPWIAAAAAVVGVAMYMHERQRDTKHRYSHSYGHTKPSWTSSQSSSSKSENTNVKNPCKICGSEIKNLEIDLTKLRCNHEFHVKCIEGHFKRNAREKIGVCPVPLCKREYSLSL